MMEKQEERTPVLSPLPYDYYKVMFIKVFQTLVDKNIISVKEAQQITKETQQEIEKMRQEVEKMTEERMEGIRKRDEHRKRT